MYEFKLEKDIIRELENGAKGNIEPKFGVSRDRNWKSLVEVLLSSDLEDGYSNGMFDIIIKNGKVLINGKDAISELYEIDYIVNKTLTGFLSNNEKAVYSITATEEEPWRWFISENPLKEEEYFLYNNRLHKTLSCRRGFYNTKSDTFVLEIEEKNRLKKNLLSLEKQEMMKYR